MTPWHGSMSALGSAAFPHSPFRTWRAIVAPHATPSWTCGQWRSFSHSVYPSVSPCNELMYGVCVSRTRVNMKKLSRNTKLIAEALARVIYNLTEKVRKECKCFLTIIHKRFTNFCFSKVFKTLFKDGNVQYTVCIHRFQITSSCTM